MKQPLLLWCGLRWPREVDEARRAELILALSSSPAMPIVLEALGTRAGVTHSIGLPARSAVSLLDRMRRALPGLEISRLPDARDFTIDRAVEVRLSSQHRPLQADQTGAVSRAILTALAAPLDGEHVVLQWHLVRILAPQVISPSATAPAGFMETLVRGSRQLDSEARSSLREKRRVTGFALVGRVGVTATSEPRQRQLIGQVIAALRAAEGPGVRWRLSPGRPSQLMSLTVPWRMPLTLNSEELALVSSWPTGDVRGLPVVTATAKRLAPSSRIPVAGRVIGTAAMSSTTDGDRERTVALSVRDGLRHVHALGPT